MVQVNGRFIDWEEDLTVEKILKDFELEFRMFIVKVNGEIFQKDQYAVKSVPKDAQIRIVPLLPGG